MTSYDSGMGKTGDKEKFELKELLAVAGHRDEHSLKEWLCLIAKW